jgi:hypothetical protein
VAVLQAPLIVNRLCRKKPARLAAWGLLFFWALLLWRLGERARRLQGETTGSTLTGWDPKATPKPTAFMLMTQLAAVLVLTGGGQRPRAQPWSAVPQASRHALGVPPPSLTLPPGG